jgi:hypothetical protein
VICQITVFESPCRKRQGASTANPKSLLTELSFGTGRKPVLAMTMNVSPRSKLRGISLAEFIDLIEASFEELDP